MARRYIGDAVITLESVGGGEYKGTISVPGPNGRRLTWKFDQLHAPRLGFPYAFDSAEAFDEMADHAAAFGSYYTTHNRSDDVPDWAPPGHVADAIDEAVSIYSDDQGNYNVTRRPTNAPSARQIKRAMKRAR